MSEELCQLAAAFWHFFDTMLQGKSVTKRLTDGQIPMVITANSILKTIKLYK